MVAADRAFCLGCGYRLHGLPEARCPECGRDFNPDDPSSVDASPRRAYRRKWMRRGVLAVTIAAILFGVAPRRLLKGSMSFSCLDCGDEITIRRWEPVAPRWISTRYPGFSYASAGQSAPVSVPAVRCRRHHYRIRVAADFPIGSCTGSGAVTDAADISVNDQCASPESAAAILKGMMAPTARGIWIGSVPEVSRVAPEPERQGPDAYPPFSGSPESTDNH
jgi:predicted RNA-binding Zn-ribbon protein involved in translation (DUF1610 family)